MKTINGEANITEDDIPKIRRLYRKALKEKKKQFVYQGHDILTDYAKYLLEYFDMMTQKRHVN